MLQVAALVEHLLRRATAADAALRKMVVKGEDMFAVVEALDVVTRGRVVGTPGS